MDNGHRTAMDLASLHDREDIIKLLDQARADEKSRNPKVVRKNQENAIVDADVRIKEFDKRQAKLQRKMQHEDQEQTAGVTAKPKNFYETLFGAPARVKSSTATKGIGSAAMFSQTGEAVLKQRDPEQQRKMLKKYSDETNNDANYMTTRTTDSGFADEQDSPGFLAGMHGKKMAFLPKMRPLQVSELKCFRLDENGEASKTIVFLVIYYFRNSVIDQV